jgi:hypothetical protein
MVETCRRIINTKHNRYNRHASTKLKSLSLVTDVKIINISLRMVKNRSKHVGELSTQNITGTTGMLPQN